MKILCAIDRSTHARFALEHAVNEIRAADRDSRLYICSVTSTESNLLADTGKFFNGLIGKQEEEIDELQEARDVISDAMKEVKGIKDIKTTQIPLAGSVGKEIVQLAVKKGVDKIVIGRFGAAESKKTWSALGRMGGTAQYIIRHHPHDCTVLLCELGSEVIEKFPKVVISEETKKQYRKVAQNSNFSEDEARLLANVFVRYDTDNSGSLERDELNELLFDLHLNPEAEEVEEAIEAVDADGSSTLEFNEFISLLRDLNSSGALNLKVILDAHRKAEEGEEDEDVDQGRDAAKGSDNFLGIPGLHLPFLSKGSKAKGPKRSFMRG